MHICKVTRLSLILHTQTKKSHLACESFSSKGSRSSMDRIKDSGSFDWGSTPHGITFQVLGDLQIAVLNG